MRKLSIYMYVFILVITMILFATILSKPFTTYNNIDLNKNIEIEDIDIEMARNLILTTCYKCHYNIDHNALSGRMHGNPKRIGDFYSPNITQDTVTGIGKWTKEELYIFFRTGIKKDGTVAFDMPKYPLLSDEDLFSLIAFLKSDDQLVRPVKHNIPEPDYSFLIKIYIKFFLRPEPLIDTFIKHPDTTNLHEFGKYLVNAKYSCFDCHSKSSILNNYSFPEKSWGYLRGGNRHANEEREIIYSTNITSDSIKGIGKYTKDEFHILLRTGINRNGKPVRDPMFPFHTLNRNKTDAIYTYLQSISND